MDPELAGTEPGLDPWVSFREAVDGLPQRPDGRHWHRGRNPTEVSKRRYKSVPRNGGDRFQMQRNLDKAGLEDLVPPCWRNKPTGTTDVFGRLWFDRPAVTIRTEFFKPEKGRYLHPSAHRPITVREAARLMSFPDDFEFPEHQSMTSVARQIGNAVPPLLAQKNRRITGPTSGLRRRSIRASRRRAGGSGRQDGRLSPLGLSGQAGAPAAPLRSQSHALAAVRC